MRLTNLKKTNFKVLSITLLITLILAAAMPHIIAGSQSWLLEYAVERGDLHTASFLIKNGTNPNMPNDGFAPLAQSLQHRHTNMSYMLISNGADINAVGPFGITPLMCADLDNPSLVSYLVQRGANVSARNDQGRTPLIIAAADLHCAAAQILLENGANPNAQDKDGQSALMEAITSNSLPSETKQKYLTVVTLLKKGADVRLKNAQGQDALSLLKRLNNTQQNQLILFAVEQRIKAVTKR